MKTLLKKTWIPIVIIGTVLTAFIFFNPTSATVIAPNLTEYTVIRHEAIAYGNYTWTFYSFDTASYIKNLANTIKPNYLADIFTQNVPTIPQLPDWTDILSVLRYIANMFIFIPNMFIIMANYLLLAPLQLLVYPLWIIMSLMGINTSNRDYVYLLNKIIHLKITYINYI